MDTAWVPASTWSTAVPDWKDRIRKKLSLIPDLPLYDAVAEKALRIFKRLRVPDIIGNPTYGEACDDWVFDFVRVIFGSYDPETKRRALREFFLLVPKKNGKSSIAAAIIITAAIMNERPEAELLLIAPTKTIAEISFKQAVGIIRLDNELTKLFQPQDHIKKITNLRTLAIIQVKAAAADVITGSKATYILIDETHVFRPYPRPPISSLKSVVPWRLALMASCFRLPRNRNRHRLASSKLNCRRRETSATASLSFLCSPSFTSCRLKTPWTVDGCAARLGDWSIRTSIARLTRTTLQAR